MSKANVSISSFYKSFSGTDTLVFILMPGSNPVVLGSLTTISYSMYRNKKPVLNLGRTNINGVTRGSRIYAGTMVFTLINQHWLNDLKEQETLKWLNEYDEIKADELPLFDLMIVCANEYGHYVSMFIYGVDLTDEAQVISIEDLFTENTFSFVARDISNFKAGKQFNKASSSASGKTVLSSVNSSRIYVLDSSGATISDIEKIEREMINTSQARRDAVIESLSKPKLARELEYSSSRMMIGNDVTYIQSLLNATKLANLNLNGVYDKDVENATKAFQSRHGIAITGKIDPRTYLALINESDKDSDRSIGIVINKSGAFAYRNANMESDVIDVKPYKDQIEILDLVYRQQSPETPDGGPVNDDSSNSQKFYKIQNGYVLADDVFSYRYCNNTIEFPTIKLNDTSVYVTMLQGSLSSIYGEFEYESGIYDIETENYVKRLQNENGLATSGIADNNIWLILQNLTGDIINGYQDSDFRISFNNIPGEYYVKNIDLSSDFMSGFNVSISSSKAITIKCSVICFFKDKTKIISNNYIVQGSRDILFSDFENAFLYDPSFRDIPDKIEYIIYPFNKESYKWTINYIR